jgi:hypothetical protein
MGEQFDLHTAMVTTPTGERLVVEARRPKLGSGEAVLVIRSVVGVERWRETLPHAADLDQRVSELAADLEAGSSPGSSS